MTMAMLWDTTPLLSAFSAMLSHIADWSDRYSPDCLMERRTWAAFMALSSEDIILPRLEKLLLS